MYIEKLEMKQARAMARMSQKDVAEKMKVTTAAVCQWETGKARISEKRFRKYCEVIGFNPNDVFLPEVLS